MFKVVFTECLGANLGVVSWFAGLAMQRVQCLLLNHFVIPLQRIWLTCYVGIGKGLFNLCPCRCVQVFLYSVCWCQCRVVSWFAGPAMQRVWCFLLFHFVIFFHSLSDPHAMSEQAKAFQLVPLSARSMFNCTLESCPISLVYVEGCLYSGCWCPFQREDARVCCMSAVSYECSRGQMMSFAQRSDT